MLGIPVIGVGDTNSNPGGVDIIIPGNDDAIRAIQLYIESAADAILEGRVAGGAVIEAAASAGVEEAAPSAVVEEAPSAVVKDAPADAVVKESASEAEAVKAVEKSKKGSEDSAE